MRSVDLYAKALFNAVSRDDALRVYSDLTLLKFLPSSVTHYYSSLVFQDKINREIYKELKSDLGEVVLDDTIKFMTVLIEDGFLEQVAEISDYYLDKLVEEEIVKKATIISAEELGQEFKDELEDKLKSKYQLPVITDYLVDKELIGGIRIELDDSVIDTSYKSRLEQIVSEGLYEVKK